MNTTPPTECPAWAALARHAQALRSVPLASLHAQDAARRERFCAEGAGLRLEYAHQRVTAETLALLFALAAERDVAGWREALYAGALVNTTEGRAAAHVLARAGAAAPAELRETDARLRELARRVRTAGRYRRVVHLGIGGSALGPQLLCDALAEPATLPEVRFVASFDAREFARAVAGADPAETLFVVCSRTFTTEETLVNLARARAWLGARVDDEQLVAVTARPERARAAGLREVLAFPETVGGRFSLWTAPSLAAVCALGEAQFDELRAGAAEMDRHFRDAPPQCNLPLIAALLGIWNVNFLGTPTHAVLAYAHALRLLPAYLQQLEMESNGKSTDRCGRAVAYATAPVVWGAEETAGQHAFHQLLHQGTHAVAADLIVVAAAGAQMVAHAEAQAEALAFGAPHEADPHRACPGDRPSSLVRLAALDARALGRLLAFYEHKVYVQGVVWNVNSFDQWGVELGKRLAGTRLAAPPPVSPRGGPSCER